MKKNTVKDKSCLMGMGKLVIFSVLFSPLYVFAEVVVDYVSSEQSISGTQSGSYSNTSQSDNVYESIAEVQNGGPPSNRESYMSHDWVVSLSVEDAVSVFHVEAHHTGNSENDDFVFSYSEDGVSFHNMLTVVKTVDDDSLQSFSFPEPLSGEITIRATDTDDTQGNNSLDTLYVDQMYIESDGTPVTQGGVTAFSGSYRTSLMTKSLSINGFEPASPGTYPIFIYVTGTKLSPWSGDDQLIVQEMAEKGFVAASVDYLTRTKYPTSCSQMLDTVEGIFNASDSGSAANILASKPKADISKGLVVMGFSQGANIASLAKNYNSDVDAAFLIGNGYVQWGATCYDASSTVISSDRLRSIVGASDSAYVFSGGPGGDISQNRMIQEITTGISCDAGATSCTASDGSGWYMVTASETTYGREDHCFHYSSGCGGIPMDSEFVGGDHFWSLGPSLEWLAGFTQQ